MKIPSATRDLVDGFRALPLWLDLGGLRIVHACWDPPSMPTVERFLSADRSLTRTTMVEASRDSSAEFLALEKVLKGPDIDLSESHCYLDPDDILRCRARMRWRDPRASTLRQVADRRGTPKDADGNELPPLPDTPVEAGLHRPYTDDVPVLFGHDSR